MNAYLEALMKAGEKHKARQFIASLEQPLRAHLQTWGHAGYILLSIGDTQKTIEWLSDWRNREGVEVWMLWNLALALRKDSRNREANEVSRYALTLQPDHLTQSNLLVLAFDELLEGNLANASSRLQKINEPTLRDWDRQLLSMVRTLERFLTTKQQGSRTHETTISSLLSDVKMTESDILVNLGRQAVELVTEDRGSLLFTALVQLRWWWVRVQKSMA